MKREVLITLRAQQEAESNHRWWAEHRSAEQAGRWYDEFLKSTLLLEDQADQHAVAAENNLFPYEVRQLNFGLSRRPTHRLVYTIFHDRVVVLRVRHLAQQAINP